MRSGVVRGPVDTKGAGDYVTEVDRASERAISEVLRAGEPSISFVGEEEGGSIGYAGHDRTLAERFFRAGPKAS